MNLVDLAQEWGTDENTIRSFFDTDPDITFGADTDEISEDTVAEMRSAWAIGADVGNED